MPSVTKYDCTYCGMRADARDHVIPVAYAYASRKAASWGKDKVVPACNECNQILKDAWIVTIPARAAYVAGILTSKYRELLLSPPWTEGEAKSLGYALRTHIQGSSNKKNLVSLRISYAIAISKTSLRPEDVWDIPKEEKEKVESEAKQQEIKIGKLGESKRKKDELKNKVREQLLALGIINNRYGRSLPTYVCYLVADTTTKEERVYINRSGTDFVNQLNTDKDITITVLFNGTKKELLDKITKLGYKRNRGIVK